MTTEAIKYVISADDKAGPVFNNLKGKVAGADKALNSMAGQAKGTGQALGIVAGSVSNLIPGMGELSGSISTATGYFGNLAESANKGGIALAAMKTAGVVAVAVATVQAIDVLGRYIFGLEELERKARAASDALKETHSNMLKAKDDDFANWLKDVQAFETPEGQNRMFENFKLAHQDDLAALQRKQQVLREVIADREAERGLAHDIFQVEDQQIPVYQEELALLEAEEKALKRQLATIKQIQIDQERQSKLDAIKEKEQAEEAARQARIKRAEEERASWREAEKEQMRMFQARQETLRKQEKEKEEWRKAEQEQLKMFTDAAMKAAEDQLDKHRSTKSILSGLKEQMISLTQGEQAARAYALGESGLDAGLANQIAQIESQMNAARSSVTVNTASESRLLTGRIEVDAAKQTANATVASQKALERATKQLDQLLAKQDQLIRNTESQLEVLK